MKKTYTYNEHEFRSRRRTSTTSRALVHGAVLGSQCCDRTGVRGSDHVQAANTNVFFSPSVSFTANELCASVRSSGAKCPFIIRSLEQLSAGLVETWLGPSCSCHPTIRDLCRLLSPYCLDCGRPSAMPGRPEGRNAMIQLDL